MGYNAAYAGNSKNLLEIRDPWRWDQYFDPKRR